METKDINMKKIIIQNDTEGLTERLRSGLNPDIGNGWLVRLAARYGHVEMVKILLQFGANPHLLNESGASALQLAVFSGKHWNTDNWSILLSCYDSSQLADGAAVAIVFNNTLALRRIIDTGRCNTNIPTTLTGKTLENLAKGYKVQYAFNIPVIEAERNRTPVSSPRTPTFHSLTPDNRLPNTPQNRNLSPSVAIFFHQSANQPGLTPSRQVTTTLLDRQN